MEHEEHGKRGKKALWGIFLMAIGGVFLLGRLGYVEIPSLWRLWPTVLMVVAAASLFERKPGSAAMMALMGLAFFAAEFNWWGLTWATFWPLLLVAVGVGIVIGAFTREDECRKDECCKREAPRA